VYLQYKEESDTKAYQKNGDTEDRQLYSCQLKGKKILLGDLLSDFPLVPSSSLDQLTEWEIENPG